MDKICAQQMLTSLMFDWDVAITDMYCTSSAKGKPMALETTIFSEFQLVLFYGYNLCMSQLCTL